MVIKPRQRVLENLAYRYWVKDKTRSSKENWRLAEKLLAYIDKRISLVKIMIGKQHE